MALLQFLRALVRRQADLALENAALRQQIAALRRRGRQPKLRARDRLFWVVLSWVWSRWRSVLLIARPATILKWHRELARWLWRRRSPGPIGRPPIPMKVIWMIKRLSRENPLWGAPRIQSELWLLGVKVSEWAVNKYMVHPSDGTRSQTWRAFLANHRKAIASCDFFLVTTATFRKLYAFVVLSLDRRRILHVAVTAKPTAHWTAAQLEAAAPTANGIHYLVHDHDPCFRGWFLARLRDLQVEDAPARPRAYWENIHVERLIGTIRRECTDHFLFLNERHLADVLREYAAYYNEARTHGAVDRNAPIPRSRELARLGLSTSPVLGGLHHRYRRAA